MYSRVFSRIHGAIWKNRYKQCLSWCISSWETCWLFQSVVIVYRWVYFFLGILYPPPPKLTYPLKIGHPNRKFHLPTIQFQGQFVSFREGRSLFRWRLPGERIGKQSFQSLREPGGWWMTPSTRSLDFNETASKKNKERSLLAMVRGRWILSSGKVIM